MVLFGPVVKIVGCLFEEIVFNYVILKQVLSKQALLFSNAGVKKLVQAKEL